MAKKNAAPVEEVEDDEIELDDEATDVEEDAAPAKSKTPAVTFGVSDLAKYLTEKLDGDKKVTPRDLRTLIRKMAREESKRVDREITPGNRTRYDWPKGLKDPEVKEIVKAVLGGEMEADKQAKLEELKANKAKKQAAAKKAAGKDSKKGKGKGKVVEADDDDADEIEIDDDDE
jgi:hypothetical protein